MRYETDGQAGKRQKKKGWEGRRGKRRSFLVMNRRELEGTPLSFSKKLRVCFDGAFHPFFPSLSLWLFPSLRCSKMKKIIDETKRQRKNRCVACCRFVCSRIFYYSLALFFPFSGRKNKNKVLRRKIFRETFWLFFYFWTFLFLFPRFFALLCFSCLIAGDA